MTKEAADRVKQIREYLSKMTPGPWCFDKRIRYDEGTVHYSIETVDKQPEHPWSQRFIAFMCGGLGGYVHNRKPSDYRDDPGAAQDADGICKLRTDAEWLLSQLSASEERVRELEGAIRNVIEASVNDADCCTVCGCDATFHCSDCAIERAESLLPSPPQVIRG